MSKKLDDKLQTKNKVKRERKEEKERERFIIPISLSYMLDAARTTTHDTHPGCTNDYAGYLDLETRSNLSGIKQHSTIFH